MKKHWGIPAYDGPVSRRIRLLVSANPKRRNTASRERFCEYHDGMTVADYVKACERFGKRNYAVFDITYDLGKGYIGLED